MCSHDALGAVDIGRERSNRDAQKRHGRMVQPADTQSASISASMLLAKQKRIALRPARSENHESEMESELVRHKALHEAHVHAREIRAKHENEQYVSRELEKLHIRHHSAAIVDRRRAAAIEAGRAAQKNFAQSRAPDWWPRELQVAPRRRPPSPRTVAASESRLTDIKAKLAARQRLTAVDESDAAAIMELRQRWAETAAAAPAF